MGSAGVCCLVASPYSGLPPQPEWAERRKSPSTQRAKPSRLQLFTEWRRFAMTFAPSNRDSSGGGAWSCPRNGAKLRIPGPKTIKKRSKVTLADRPPRYRLCHRRFSPLHCHVERSDGSALKIAARVPPPPHARVAPHPHARVPPPSHARVAPASQPAVAWASLPTLTLRQHFHGRGRRTATCLSAVVFRNPKVVIPPNRRRHDRCLSADQYRRSSPNAPSSRQSAATRDPRLLLRPQAGETSESATIGPERGKC